MAGVSSGLCAGTEPGRVLVVTLETARVAKPLPHYLRAVEPSRTQSPATDAPTAYAGDRILAAGRAVSIVTILCNSQYYRKEAVWFCHDYCSLAISLYRSHVPSNCGRCLTISHGRGTARLPERDD